MPGSALAAAASSFLPRSTSGSPFRFTAVTRSGSIASPGRNITNTEPLASNRIGIRTQPSASS